MSWFSAQPDGWLLQLHVQPGARQTRVIGLHGGALKISLAAPPVDGKANAALCQYLARCFAVPQASVQLLSGHNSRQKRVRVCSPRAPDTVLLAEDKAGRGL